MGTLADRIGTSPKPPMFLGTTIHDEVVEMRRVCGSSWQLTLDGQPYAPLQSFCGCVVVSQRMIPVHRRRDYAREVVAVREP